MSVTGLCQICENATAQYQCERCGTMACQRHFDTQLGMCVDCARQTGRREPDSPPGQVPPSDRTHR